MSESLPQIITKRFISWDDIPNVDHLRKIENSYIDAFGGDIIFISYAIIDNKIVAFGSAGYYEKDNNYGDEEADCDIEFYGNGSERHLWIEGLVSTVKGLGRMLLSELEKKLINIAREENIEHRIINIISVEDAIGFYDNCGYIECVTSPRFAGTENIRCSKAFDDYDIKKSKIVEHDISEDEWEIYNFLILGRRKMCDRYLNILKNIHYTKLLDYALENLTLNLFKDSVSLETKEKQLKWILKCHEELNSY